MPGVRYASIWFYNGEDQDATVQVIGNISANKMYPDFDIGSAVTVDAGSAGWIIINPPAYEFVSVQVSYATAPSKGDIKAILLVY